MLFKGLTGTIGTTLVTAQSHRKWWGQERGRMADFSLGSSRPASHHPSILNVSIPLGTLGGSLSIVAFKQVRRDLWSFAGRHSTELRRCSGRLPRRGITCIQSLRIFESQPPNVSQAQIQVLLQQMQQRPLSCMHAPASLLNMAAYTVTIFPCIFEPHQLAAGQGGPPNTAAGLQSREVAAHRLGHASLLSNLRVRR